MQRIGFAFGILVAVPLAVAGFLGLLLAGRSAEHGEAVVVVTFSAVFAGWLLLPVLMFASDETLDPARLALLPLRRRRLLAGLFAASLLVWIWGEALTRSLTTTSTSTASGADSETDLFPRLARFLPRDRRGAVAAKDLRYWARDPRLRAAWIATAAFGAAPIALVLFSEPARHPQAVLLAVAVLWLASFHTLNQFGGDGPAFWTNAVAAGDPRDDVVGKNVGLAIPLLAYVTIIALALAAITGGRLYVPAALGLAVSVLAAALAVGNVVSIRAPTPVQRSSTNVWAGSGPGRPAFALLVAFLAFAVLGVLVAPVTIGVGLALVVGPDALAVALVLAIVYGLGLWRVGVLIADEHLRREQPELLERLTPSRN